MNKILEIKDLSKSYYTNKGEIKAIDNVSLDVSENDFLCIIGSSGCGKSTLLSIIAGLESPTRGEIVWNKEKPKIGYMLQDDALFSHLTVLENATLGLKINHDLSADNLLYVKKLLNNYGLGSFINKYPKELSGGMRQRVALIRTLAIKPDILLLDEPFSALDYQTRLSVSKDVYNIIKKEGKSVIMITHDIAEALSLANKVVVLSKRPAIVKKTYLINYNEVIDPIEKRSTFIFNNYYHKLWKDLDNNVS